MKNTFRIISLLLVLLFSTIVFANAETIDLSTLSFDELVALRQQIDMAIMQSDEWKQVTVPVGTYIIGKDIPSGDYAVAYTGRVQSFLCIYPDIQSVGDYQCSSHLLSSMMGNTTIGKLCLTEGQVIVIEYGELVFSPYKGLDF